MMKLLKTRLFLLLLLLGSPLLGTEISEADSVGRAGTIGAFSYLSEAAYTAPSLMSFNSNNYAGAGAGSLYRSLENAAVSPDFSLSAGGAFHLFKSFSVGLNYRHLALAGHRENFAALGLSFVLKDMLSFGLGTGFKSGKDKGLSADLSRTSHLRIAASVTWRPVSWLKLTPLFNYADISLGGSHLALAAGIQAGNFNIGMDNLYYLTKNYDFRAAAEYMIAGMINVKAGVSLSEFSLGLGVIPGFLKGWVFDYGFIRHKVLGPGHAFSCKVYF